MSIPSIKLVVTYTLTVLFVHSQSFQIIHVPSPKQCNRYDVLSRRTKHTMSNNDSSPLHILNMASNPIDDETEEERKLRMELVRQLQKSFYLDETESAKPPKKGSTIIEDLPLWRTQWTELPGFQNVLNVHVPHYTNMFQKIIRSSSSSSNNDTKYFGHLYLPGGSENLDNSEYRLEQNTNSTLTGVLMKITSHEELEDGRLRIVVQALEKFRVVEAKRHHSPYSIATVEIVPDEELVRAQDMLRDDVVDDDGLSLSLDDEGDYSAANAVAEAFNLHAFEFQPVTSENEVGAVSAVSPLVNYDINFKEVKAESAKYATSIDDSILELEYKIWIHIDEMIRLLQSFVAPLNVKPIPIPTQIVGLLPTHPIHPWPQNFILEDYAIKLEQEKTLIGTYSKSEFVRVDNHQINYPPLRRVHRLSYVLWALTDSLVLPDSTDACFARQNVLELDSLEKRLDIGLRKLQLICVMIRNVLNQNR